MLTAILLICTLAIHYCVNNDDCMEEGAICKMGKCFYANTYT